MLPASDLKIIRPGQEIPPFLAEQPRTMGQTYRTPRPDKRASSFRAKANQMQVRDLGSKSMRWALHLSDLENDALERLNPETLGRHDDERLRAHYWADFISKPESAPFRVRGRV